jgi:hypothetical protein
MAAVTPKFKFGFVLKDGPTNIRNFSEGSTQAFNKGDIVKMSSGKVVQFTTPSDSTKTTTGIESGIIGVAAKDATGTANSLIPVYVITPEQVWEVHAQPGKKPSTKATYDEGKNVKLAYKAVTTYTLSNGTTTSTTTVGAWYAQSTTGSAGKGVVIVGYRRGDEGIKGGRMLVRFTSHACDSQY